LIRGVIHMLRRGGHQMYLSSAKMMKIFMFVLHLVNVAEKFSADIFSPGFFVVKDPGGCREDDHPE